MNELRIEDLTRTLWDAGVRVLCGVPDSTLPNLAAVWAREGREHVAAANEGSAVCVAAGYRIAGRSSAVYLQNTGLGVAVDAHGSLTGADVLEVPSLWLVGWRGHPDRPDQAHHRWHGEHSELLCNRAGFKLVRVSRAEGWAEDIAEAAARVEQGRSCAVLFEPGMFARQLQPLIAGFSRSDAIKIFLDCISPQTMLVAGVGYVGRELAYHRSQRGETSDDIYASGGMGHAAALALGIARAQRGRPVACLDGDGAFTMHMGAALAVAQGAPPDFVHVVLDNGCHESVGGDSTLLQRTDTAALGQALGYARVGHASSAAELKNALQEHAGRAGPLLLIVRVVPGASPVPQRPSPRTPQDPTPCGAEAGPRLFTPGPGRLHASVARAMCVESGSRSPPTSRCRSNIRRRLTEMVADDSYACAPIAGSGTTALDALLASVVPPRSRVLCVTAGRYGERIAEAAEAWGHQVTRLEATPAEPFEAARLEEALAQSHFDWVSVVHGETSTGVLHPLLAIASAARRHGVAVLLDIVGTIGTVDIQLAQLSVDAAFASAAKGLEGPSGLGIAFVSRERLRRVHACASTTLDLPAHIRRFERDGQSRFTPATGSLRGLEAALCVLAEEGGPSSRRARYEALAGALTQRLARMGQYCTVPVGHRMPLVLSMRSDSLPATEIIERLRALRIELYPAAADDPQAYRLGLVGVRPDDVEALCTTMPGVLAKS